MGNQYPEPPRTILGIPTTWWVLFAIVVMVDGYVKIFASFFD